MSTQFRFREPPPDTDDAELIRAWAERTRRVGAPGYTRAAEYHPEDYDGERQFWREARYMKPLYALTHGPVDARGNATGLDHDVLMKVMSSLPGNAPWQEGALQGEGYGLAMLDGV
jgi:hypothetical protein